MLNFLFELSVALGIDIFEGEVGHFDAEQAHIEPVSERCENFERFFGDFALLVRRKSGEGAEIMEAIGELDDKDTDVIAKSNHQPEEVILGLWEISVNVTHAVASGGEFRNSINEKRDRFAEFLLNVGKSEVGVLNGVVKDAGNNGILVHPPLLEDFLDGERMNNIRFASLAKLTLVGFLRHGDGAFDTFGILVLGLHKDNYNTFRQMGFSG